MSDILLIPSAGTVPDEMKLDVGPIPTGMVPLHGKPSIEHIIDSFVDCGDCDDITVVVAHQPKHSSLVNWTRESEYKIERVQVESPSTLATTVSKTIDAIDERGVLGNNHLYVQFADTLVFPTCVDGDKDQIVYDTVDHPVRWTTFKTSSGGKIESVSEKFSGVSNSRSNTFVGQFRFEEPRAFLQELIRAMESSDSSAEEVSAFYRAVLSYLSGRTYEIRQPSKWIDLGHLDTYYRAKLDYLNVREFNELEIDSQSGVLTKQSDNTSVLNDELNWYRNIPAAIQPYTPEIYDYELGENPSIMMEYLGYPPLSDIHLYGHHGLHIWRNIFSTIFDIVEEFRGHCMPNSAATENMDALQSMYVDKTVSRLERVRNQQRFDLFFDSDEIIINGDQFYSLPRILDSLLNDVESVGLLELDSFTVIHGDLCFPNILFDVRSGNVKLIDPRGDFGGLGIYGDYRYDLAKLIHSAKGNYEFIINDRFTVDVDGDGVDYTIHTTDQHQEREQLFDSMIEARYPKELSQLYAIESLLWLSMAALHGDSRERQYVMLAQGIEKYNQSFNQR